MLNCEDKPLQLTPKVRLPEVRAKTNLFPIALPDAFGPTGTYNYLLDYHGLTGQKIAQKVLKFFQNQKFDK